MWFSGYFPPVLMVISSGLSLIVVILETARSLFFWFRRRCCKGLDQGVAFSLDHFVGANTIPSSRVRMFRFGLKGTSEFCNRFASCPLTVLAGYTFGSTSCQLIQTCIIMNSKTKVKRRTHEGIQPDHKMASYCLFTCMLSENFFSS